MSHLTSKHNSKTVPVWPSLIFPSHLLPYPVSSFCFFPGFLAIFILLSSNNNSIVLYFKLLLANKCFWLTDWGVWHLCEWHLHGSIFCVPSQNANPWNLFSFCWFCYFWLISPWLVLLFHASRRYGLRRNTINYPQRKKKYSCYKIQETNARESSVSPGVPQTNSIQRVLSFK